MSACFETFKRRFRTPVICLPCNDFRFFWYDVMKEDIILSLKDVVVGVSGNIHVVFSYCILVEKSLIYYCRRN